MMPDRFTKSRELIERDGSHVVVRSYLDQKGHFYETRTTTLPIDDEASLKMVDNFWNNRDSILMKGIELDK